MMILKFIPLAVIEVFATLVAFIFNPVVVLFANEEGWLPRWLWWFQTFDSSLDTGWQDKMWSGRFWDGRYRYLARVRWLYRNHNYGFDYSAIGIPFVADDWKVVRFTGWWTGNKLQTFYAVDGKGHFNYMISPIFGGRTLKLGWKAWNMYDSVTGKFGGQWGPENRIPFCLSI